MSDFTLPRYATGDVDYVSKMDNSADLTEAAIRALQDSVGGGGLGVISFAFLLAGLFDGSPALVGYDSYSCAGSGAVLTVQPGTAWKPSTQVVVQFGGPPASIDFTGQPAATYYLAIDASGLPSRSTDSSEAFYSIVWDGTAFGDITRTANCFMTAAEEQALLHSTARSMDFATLLARLESDEALIGGGSPSFADDEIVSGSGTSWTLAHPPSPEASLRVYQDITGYGLVGLKRVVSLVNAEDFTVSGTTLTTQTSFSSGALHAFYRY